MESKIERLKEFNWFEGRDSFTIALDNTIIKKLNQVIDHLNLQDQEEVSAVEGKRYTYTGSKLYDDDMNEAIVGNRFRDITKYLTNPIPDWVEDTPYVCTCRSDFGIICEYHKSEMIKDISEERGIAGTTDDYMKGITPEESDVQELAEKVNEIIDVLNKLTTK